MRTVILLFFVGFSRSAESLEVEEIPDDEIIDAATAELMGCAQVGPDRIDVESEDGILRLSGSVASLLEKRHAERHLETLKGVRAIVNQLSVLPSDLSDKKIQRNIVQALFRDPATESFETDVTVKDGVATLTGTVDSYAECRLVEEVAAGAKGIRGVKNKVVVDYKLLRPDAEIKADVVRQLAVSAWIDDGLIDVQVEDGKVTLTGSVGSVAEKREARLRASVAGVETVDEEGLQVEWWLRDAMRRKSRYADLTDEQIEKAVRDSFVHDPRVLSLHPRVSVSAGTVTLTGTVSNLSAKRAAEDDARNTKGVWRVRNFLRVRGNWTLSDTEIEKNVEEALKEDVYLERHDITSKIHHGQVYLFGTVDSYFERSQAEDVVSRVDGVVAVINRLAVLYDFSDLSDLEIEASIEDQLKWSPYVDEDEVDVTVIDAVATLTGTVASWMARGAAQDNAMEGGARRVINRIVVEGDS